MQISTVFLNYMKVAERTEVKNGRFMYKSTACKGFRNSCLCRKGIQRDIYQTQWNADIRARLTTVPETRPGVPIEDKSAIAVINNGKTVGHIPKLLTKPIFFFLKMVTNYTLQ